MKRFAGLLGLFCWGLIGAWRRASPRRPLLATVARADSAASVAALLNYLGGTTAAATTTALQSAIPSLAATAPECGSGAAGAVAACGSTLVLPNGAKATTQVDTDTSTDLATDAFASSMASINTTNLSGYTTYSLSYGSANLAVQYFTGMTSNVTVTMPVAEVSADILRSWWIVENYGAYNLTFAGTGGGTVTVASGQAEVIWTDGTGIYSGLTGAAHAQSTVSAPTAPASTAAYKMQGLAGTITPTRSGSVLIVVSGTIVAPTGTTVDNGILYQLL